MKKWITGSLIFIGLVLLGWAGYYYWQSSPRYSLYQMAKAIKNNDPEKFLFYIDLDQVVATTFEELQKDFSPSKKEEKPDNEKILPGDKINKKLKNFINQLPQILKPALEQKITREIRNMKNRDKIYPLIFATLSRIKKKGNNKCEVTVKVPNEKTYQFTMEKRNNQVWKVVM
ncbi:MAG: DUF2939 domain-containing protein, partial [Desulfobacterota bacterium]|nr:DUF2939 domain-containing protein [Thermodesulfobacteriota bacterium]